MSQRRRRENPIPFPLLLTTLIGLALSAATGAQQATFIEYTPAGAEITITDLGVLPGGTFSSGLAINNQPVIVGLANDSNFELERPFWDANTGAIIGFADNFNPASTAIPEHINDGREMAGTEMYGDNVYQGIYWNSIGQAFVLPPMAGVDPFYGSNHTKAHGINNLGQIVGTGKEGEPDFLTHPVLWPDKDTEAIDLGFLGQGEPFNSGIAYGINDLSHVVGNGTVGTLVLGFLWRDGQLTNLGTLGGQIVSEAYAVSNGGVIVGRANIFPVLWTYDVSNPSSTPTITQLPMPSGFFSATPKAVNDAGDVAGYAGSPNIDAHAILWRDGLAIDLGVWPGGHYSVATGINELGQISGTGTVAGDNLDHALMWTFDDGTSNSTPIVTLQAKPTRIYVLESVSVKVSFTDPDNGPWSYTVAWGDGSSTSGITSTEGKISGINPHIYTQAGKFGINVSVTDAEEATGVSNTVMIKVR